jgi:hypothetical protein
MNDRFARPPSSAVQTSPGRASLHQRRGWRSALGGAAVFLVAALGFPASGLAAADPLDWLDQSLFLQSANGRFRSDLSGLLDLEGYYIDQRPPGLIGGDDEEFINPRLSLFLDTRLGDHFYSLLQARFDRGFDPRASVRDARADEYLLRYTPFDDARLNVQVGKFATVFGNWVPRHDSWQNPFLNAPLPYEHATVLSDQVTPAAGVVLARRATPANKRTWLPVIWGPSYASGASVFGTVFKLDYALEVKNAALSSRPYVWDGATTGWERPSVTGRLGHRPNAAWNLGASFSYGPYLMPAARATLPPSRSLGDFNQITVGQDVSFAWRHWQVWGEAIASRFAAPFLGDADTIAYFLEAKYKITPRFFAAARWNQQLFDKVPNGVGGLERWDRDIWRIEAALGYRFTRHLQAKLQYGYSHQKGSFQQGEQVVAGQVTLKF